MNHRKPLWILLWHLPSMFQFGIIFFYFFIYLLTLLCFCVSVFSTSSSTINDAISSGPKTFDPYKTHIEPGINITPYTVEMDEEDGTRISLTVVDTPGFGDNIDNTACFDEILRYLELQYDEILAEESRIRRNPRFKDNRIHVLLYFIEPTGHGLREIDVELMRRLSKRVNVIPVLGRADSLTQSELALAKKLTMEDIEQYNIPIYNFPYDVEEDDAETIEENSFLKAMLPFAIVSATDFIKTQEGHFIRARRYPWGIVDIENPDHSDYSSLRAAILGSHMADLKDLTHYFLYETYRTEKLSQNIADPRESALLNPEDLANQSYILKEEQLQREEEKLREIEMRVQREINEKRMELMTREQELREIEARLSREKSESLAAEEHQLLQRQIEQQNLELQLKQHNLLREHQQQQEVVGAAQAAVNATHAATNGSNGVYHPSEEAYVHLSNDTPSTSETTAGGAIPVNPGVSQDVYDPTLHNPSAVHDYETKLGDQIPEQESEQYGGPVPMQQFLASSAPSTDYSKMASDPAQAQSLSSQQSDLSQQ